MHTALTLALALTAVAAAERADVVVVVGAAGEREYAPVFRDWAKRWEEAAAKAGAGCTTIGLDSVPAKPDRDRLRDTLAALGTAGKEPLWLVLIGHGTFEARVAKFNLRGPDVTDAELSDWLKPVTRPLVVLDCASASAPFLTKLSGTNRVVISATRSGSEVNYARFGEFLAGAVADGSADVDKDGQVSLLEAFLTAGRRTAEWYKSKSRLATEHPLLDDNGDRMGTPPDFFQGLRVTRKARDNAAPDGLRAHQLHLLPSDRERALPPELRRRRDELERAVAALRDEKPKLKEDDYYARLEPLLVELARLCLTEPGATGPAREPQGGK